MRERVLESTPSFLRRNIRGVSMSEHFFHLFLAFLHDAGLLDQPTPPPTAVHVALRNSLAFVDRLLVSIGSPSLKIALVATNGRCFVATGCAYPMRYLHVEGISDCPVCHAANDRSERATGAAFRTRRCARWSSRRTATWRRAPAGRRSPIARR